MQFGTYSNMDEAWQVTANNALAAVLVMLENVPDSTIFQQYQQHIQTQSLEPYLSQRLRKHLVGTYGYQFATFLFEKSTMCGYIKQTTLSLRAQKEERRAQRRYQQAWEGTRLIEDHPMYWKEV